MAALCIVLLPAHAIYATWQHCRDPTAWTYPWALGPGPGAEEIEGTPGTCSILQAFMAILADPVSPAPSGPPGGHFTDTGSSEVAVEALK